VLCSWVVGIWVRDGKWEKKGGRHLLSVSMSQCFPCEYKMKINQSELK